MENSTHKNDIQTHHVSVNYVCQGVVIENADIKTDYYGEHWPSVCLGFRKVTISRMPSSQIVV